MKKLFAVLLAAALLLSLAGCAGESGEVLYPYANRISIFTATVMEDGIFTQDNAFLYFIDYATGQMVPYCARPSCQHNSADCDAWIYGEDPADLDARYKFIANNRLFTVEPAVQEDNPDTGEPGPVTPIKISNLDYSGEKTLARVKGVPFIFYLYGNSMYTVTSVTKTLASDMMSGSSGDEYMVSYLTEIDLKKEKAVREIILAEGYNAIAGIQYIYGDYAYLSIFAYDEPKDYTFALEIDSLDDIEDMDAYREKWAEGSSMFGWYRMDLKTGEITPWEDGYPAEYGGPHVQGSSPMTVWSSGPLGVWQDWVIYQDDRVRAWNMQTGEERVIREEPIWILSEYNAFAAVIGNKALYYRVSEDDPALYRYDFETEETSKITGKGLDEDLWDALHETDQYLYVYANHNYVNWQNIDVNTLMVYRLDITNGYEDCEWEVYRLPEYEVGYSIVPGEGATRFVIPH